MTWVFFASFPFTHLLIIYSLLGQMSTTHTLSPSNVMAKNPIQATCNEVHEDLRGIPLESSDTGTCSTDFCLKSSSEAAIYHPQPTAARGVEGPDVPRVSRSSRDHRPSKMLIGWGSLLSNRRGPERSWQKARSKSEFQCTHS